MLYIMVRFSFVSSSIINREGIKKIAVALVSETKNRLHHISHLLFVEIP